MNIRKPHYTVFCLLAFLSVAFKPISATPRGPKFLVEETLVSYSESSRQNYLAFPAIVETGESEVLVSYKRGDSHARDLGAVLEIILINRRDGSYEKPAAPGLATEIIGLGVSLAVFVVFFFLHLYLSGVSLH